MEKNKHCEVDQSDSQRYETWIKLLDIQYMLKAKFDTMLNHKIVKYKDDIDKATSDHNTI